jgi:hypothetical protein
MLLAVQFHFQEWLAEKIGELGLGKDFHETARDMGLSDLAQKPLLGLTNGGLFWRCGVTKTVWLNMPKTVNEKLLISTGKKLTELHQREKLAPPCLTKRKGDTNTRDTR